VKRGGAADDYRAWKADVATEMERQHRIAASIIPESAPTIGPGTACGALLGRVPRLAQRRVILFFWPMRASSWNHSSMASTSTAFRARLHPGARGVSLLNSSIAPNRLSTWRAGACGPQFSPVLMGGFELPGGCLGEVSPRPMSIFSFGSGTNAGVAHSFNTRKSRLP
jgi:hypothetical protein